MISKAFNFILFLITLTWDAHAHGFWWGEPSTTETPHSNFKHIPLTYYRTYTYQPLTANPFTFPFLGNGNPFNAFPQTPIVAGARFDQFSYPGSGAPSEVGSLTSNFNKTPKPTTAEPTTTSTTTTTTTTTTPQPTTEKSTTTTTQNILTKQIDQKLVNIGGGTFQSIPDNYDAVYPAYNRRLNSNFNYKYHQHHRPIYPYPDYESNNRPMPSSSSSYYGGSGSNVPSHVQFVPCMCPVSVGVPSGLPITGPGNGMSTFIQSSNSEYFPQGRTNADDQSADNNYNKQLTNNANDDAAIANDKYLLNANGQGDALVTMDENPQVLSNKIEGLRKKINDNLAASLSSEQDS